MNKSKIKLESEIIQQFRANNEVGNTIHFDWDRMSETPADFILTVITKNFINGQLFLLKKVQAPTQHQCLLDMLTYIQNDFIEDEWEVKWTCNDDTEQTSHFKGKDEEEIRSKFYFDEEYILSIISINKL